MSICTRMWAAMLAVLSNRRGVSATEYSLMVVGIAALVLAGASTLGGNVSSALHSIGAYVSNQGAAI